MIDTLREARKLEETGFTSEQAVAIIEIQYRPPSLIMNSGEHAKVRGRDWIFLPPLDDLADEERSDFFQVWGNGKAFQRHEQLGATQE